MVPIRCDIGARQEFFYCMAGDGPDIPEDQPEYAVSDGMPAVHVKEAALLQLPVQQCAGCGEKQMGSLMHIDTLGVSMCLKGVCIR
jgi:hypothetical protein